MQQRTSRMHVKKEIIGKKEISWVPDQMVVTSSSTPSSTTPPDQTKKLLWFMQKGRRRPQQQMMMALKMPAIRRRPRSNSSRFTFSSSFSSTIFHGLRGMLICVSFGLVCITIATVLLCMRDEEEVSNHPREITPFPAKLVSALPQFQGAHRERLYWGTYRPNLYLGIRARTPKSLLAGLMWLGLKQGQGSSLRHTCDESDGLARYSSWVRHDGTTYGRQEIVDGSAHISISFFKSKELGSGYGGDWVVRVLVQPIKRKEDEEQPKHPHPNDVSFFFYLANEEGCPLKLFPKQPLAISMQQDDLIASGSTKEIGGWELHTIKKEGTTMNYMGSHTNHMHNLTELVWQALETQARRTGTLQLPDDSDNLPNIAIFQVSGKAPMELDFVLVSGTQTRNARVNLRVKNLSGAALSKRLTEQEEKFEQRFESTFKLKNQVKLGDREIEVGQVAMSGLLGGIAYFYGQSRIAIPLKLRAQQEIMRAGSFWENWSAALYTAVRSRSSYPHGYFADEGYHQLLISQWDWKLSKDMIAHWLDLINVDGWIPHQQILGDEAQSKVSDAALIQNTESANPPSLFLVLHKLATQYETTLAAGKKDPEDLSFLKAIFPRLKAWFHWFNSTQTGKVAGSFYWHGRDAESESELNPKTVMSGMDDYPRASHPSKDERHLDLHCWMAFASQTMAKIASLVDISSYTKYRDTAAWLTDLKLLNELYYEERLGRYFDFGNHSEMIKLYQKTTVEPRTGYVHSEVQRLVMELPELRWVPQYGYNSLFPLVFRMFPLTSLQFAHQLVLLQSEMYLWTDYGLRSLAASSSMFMKHNMENESPHWRGRVWLNINYLVLSALDYYSKEPGLNSDKATDVYLKLRENIIRNVVECYYESGYLWESYDNSNNGEGSKGFHPFAGSTALIVLIMGEIY
ncbi:unnamed protein product [Sphagnum balticum]